MAFCFYCQPTAADIWRYYWMFTYTVVFSPTPTVWAVGEEHHGIKTVAPG